MKNEQLIGTFPIGETSSNMFDDLHQSRLLDEFMSEPRTVSSVPDTVAVTRSEIAATGEADKLVISDK